MPTPPFPFSPREWHTGGGSLPVEASLTKTHQAALWTLDLEKGGGARARSGRVLGTESEWGKLSSSFP